MKQKIIYSCLLFILISCQNEPKSTGIFVDIDEISTISMFNIFEKVEIVSLETLDESLIKRVSRVICINDKYYIFDGGTSQIFIFDLKGKYINKINNRGGGPEEYNHISDFDIDIDNKIISILSPNDNTLHDYDLDGNFLIRRRLPQIERAYMNCRYINGDTLVFWSADEKNKLKFYSKASDHIYHETFPEQRNLRNIFSTLTFPYSNYLCRSSTNDVYQYFADGRIEIGYTWDFGKYNNEKTVSETINEKDINSLRNYAKSIYSSEIVNYIISSHGGNSKYKYAQIYRKGFPVNIFHNKETLNNIVFHQTKEGAELYPVYWADNYIIGIERADEDIEKVIPDEILDTENLLIKNQRKIADNPILIKYTFNQASYKQ